MPDNPFFEKMNSLPDHRLKEMVERHRDQYQPEALVAAEEILRSRNVMFIEAEPVEEIEMTYEEIREDIRVRRAKGQSMSGIREYYKSCGVDIDSPEIRRGEESPSSRPWSFREIRLVFFMVGGLGAVLVAVNDHGFSGGALIALLVLGSIIGIWAWIRFRT